MLGSEKKRKNIMEVNYGMNLYTTKLSILFMSYNVNIDDGVPLVTSKRGA